MFSSSPGRPFRVEFGGEPTTFGGQERKDEDCGPLNRNGRFDWEFHKIFGFRTGGRGGILCVLGRLVLGVCGAGAAAGVTEDDDDVGVVEVVAEEAGVTEYGGVAFVVASE
jgi:hypothetical protein